MGPLAIGGAMAGAGMLMNALGPDHMAGAKRDINQYFKQVKGRGAPQAGIAAMAGQSDFRRAQSGLVSRLDAMSRGEGPSLATEQLRQATDRNMKQQASIANSGRGNAALAGITASNASAGLGAQAGSDAAMARIAEQQMAIQQLGSVSGQARQQDNDLNQFNALQKNYRDQFNIEAKLRARGMDDESIRHLLTLKMNLGQQAQQSSMGNQLMAGGAGLMSMGAQPKPMGK